MTKFLKPFQVTYAEGGTFDWDKFDVDWFCEVPNADIAQKRLNFLRTAGNIYKLRKHGFGGPALERMWRAVLRACLSNGIALPSTQTHLAQELGLIVP